MARTYRWSEKGRAARVERMKQLHADPAFNPLAGMDDRQKKIYRKLVSCGVEAERAIAAARESDQ